MPGTKNIFSKYKSKYFVETGSYIGEGIENAINVGFENIISIELSDDHHKYCIEKFKNFYNVEIIKGDSCQDLYPTIKNIDDRITFWLDGHWSGEGTAISRINKISPLLEELEQIKQHHIKNHTILIDDMRCWKKSNPKIEFGLEEIKSVLLDINSNYIIDFEDGYASHTKEVFEKDILVAYIK